MEETIKVNFHCHSDFSDGELSPESLAAYLASTSIRYAALTDHDTIDGFSVFNEAFKKRGGASISGVEITTWYKGQEIHLLGYGFDPNNPVLIALLASIRQRTAIQVHSITGSLRKRGSNNSTASAGLLEPYSDSPDGQVEIHNVIRVIHHAGGVVFLAHPLQYTSTLEQLSSLLIVLKEKGLDGIEALYGPYTSEQQTSLIHLAQNLDLLICAGTDLHGGNIHDGSEPGIEFPREKWITFRRAVIGRTPENELTKSQQEQNQELPSEIRSPETATHKFHRRSNTLRILLPTLIAIALFLSAIWGIILPSFEQSLIDRKREMIRELTNSAWSILVSYEQDVTSGAITRDEAQQLAAARIKALRYGPEGKDYFWIQNMEPRMVMHPFREDLNGNDLSDFTDPNGVKIFVKFVDLVLRDGEGYADYVWQWKDDPARLEPKQSYVKGFEPWGWIIGTGLYVDDVREEVGRLERHIVNTALIVSGVVVLLLVFVLQLSLRVEHQRRETLDDLKESNSRYRALVEATTEGTLLVINQRCRYANPTFLGMTGYSDHQLDYMELPDLLPCTPENENLWKWLDKLQADWAQESGTFDGVISTENGSLLECIIILNPIDVSGQRGLILLARDITRQEGSLSQNGIYRAAATAPVGIFRAHASRRAGLIEMNPTARGFFDDKQPFLAELFSDEADFDEMLKKLLHGEKIQDLLLQVGTRDADTRFLSLSASSIKEDGEENNFIDGVILDVTREKKLSSEREALIEKLQTSLLFLHEPISHLGRAVLKCHMQTSVSQLSKLMTINNDSAALVTSENGTVIGIVTDHDLRARVLSANLPSDTPVHQIMSSPITKISADALVYEALILMEETGVRHLAVEDNENNIISLIDNKELVQFQRYAPITLSREISRANSLDEIFSRMERIPALATALINSSTRPRHMTNMLSSICDSVTERLITLAIEELGPLPADFAFIAMGSQGRQELTLVTDQDNGIIFSPLARADIENTRAYFLALGERVCDGLSRAGYYLCRGGVMAKNPRWCRSLDEWILDFNDWIQKSEPQEVINLSIFFDFRTVYGQYELALDLRRQIFKTLKGKPSFFPYFAQNVLSFKPPSRFLGGIYLGGVTTEPGGEINLKDAMMPLVSFVRLYSLENQINQTHTLGRIDALYDKNVITQSSRDELVAAYEFLMQLRLKNQVDQIQSGQLATNNIHPGKLGEIQKESLKQAFAQISAVQKKVSYDFLGGT